jgi:hypothetical protein
MNTEIIIDRMARSLKPISRLLVLLICCAFFVSTASAQQTPGGTVISNQASATYGDGTNSFSTVSNVITVTVSNVSGITITPDAGSHATIIPGQLGVLYTFRVTNTGNFADQVRFLQSGASIQITGAGTIFAAVIDVDGGGTIDGTDTDILANGADVLSASILQNGYVDVIVSVNVNGNAAPASSINIQLGDATTGSPTYDNQAAGTISAHEIRTVSGSSVNGLREARGDISAVIDTDALLVLSLTAPAGPVALGSDITYSWQVCNTNGLRDAQSTTLTNAPGGSNTGVFMIVPIPVGTAVKSGQSFPAGTLYSVSPLTDLPRTVATYTTGAPADLTTVRRVAFRVGATLGLGTCATAVPLVVTIITTDATLDIYEIGDTFSMNNVTLQLTDQSGDTVANIGDGNANFSEGAAAGNVDGDGIVQTTLVTRTGAALIGPLNTPTAVGPVNNNDDYTNRSITTGIAGIAFGGTTSADGTIVYSNTLRNTGNANDTFVITRQSSTAGFTVEISVNGLGTDYVTMTTNSVSLAIAYNTNATILVRVTAPSGTAILQASGFDVVIRSTSTLTSSAYNETIDRLYTGFLRMVKTAPVTNGTGVGGATDPVPGAVIEYTIVYTNISSTGGTGNLQLTVTNLVITENGSAGTNNWGTTTDHVTGSASDTLGGTITGNTAPSSVLTDTITSLAPQATGTFKFRRVIH